MQEKVARALVEVMSNPENGENLEAFERAFELTKAYAASSGAQASAIPVVFEKMFDLFVTGGLTDKS
jgi:hypothetical protein